MKTLQGLNTNRQHNVRDTQEKIHFENSYGYKMNPNKRRRTVPSRTKLNRTEQNDSAGIECHAHGKNEVANMRIPINYENACVVLLLLSLNQNVQRANERAGKSNRRTGAPNTKQMHGKLMRIPVKSSRQ